MLVLLCLASLPAAAQGGGLTISEATLRLSPEYDDPGLLVIFSGSFANIGTYPQEISFPVPANVRGIQATEEDATQTLLTRQWQKTGDQISYKLERQPSFQFEYYMERQPSGNDRVINYSWQAPYPITSLILVVQQPARSTNFALTPKAESASQGSDGLTTYQIKRANVAAGEKIDLAIRYTKTDQNPSFSRTDQTAAGAQSQPANGTQAVAGAQAAPSTNPLAFVLIGVGFAALAGAAVYWFIERRRVNAPAVDDRQARSAPARSTSGARMPVPDSNSESRYCPKCGRAYQPGDRFCGSCGTPR